MRHILVRATFDYADEFDVYGLLVTTEDQWNKFTDWVGTYLQDNTEYYFGTNEALEFDSFSQFIGGFKTEVLAPAEYERFKHVLGGEKFGIIPFYLDYKKTQ